MKKKTEKRAQRDELRREHDLSKLKGGVRGKYTARYRAGTNLVLLSPDVAEYFPDEHSVNKALRTLIQRGRGLSAARADVQVRAKSKAAPFDKPRRYAPPDAKACPTRPIRLGTQDAFEM